MHSLKIALSLFLFLVLNDFTTGTIIYIPGDYQSIQAGLDNREYGDTVIVQPGIYYENLNITGGDFALASNYLLTGDTSYISSTIIDGDYSGRVINISDMAQCEPLIAGLTIQHGSFSEGAGLFIEYVDIVLRNNIIASNHAISDGISYAYGGGIYCYGGNPVIQDNLITRNSAEYNMYKDGFGGGICCINSNAIVSNNIIIENSASGVTSGGGGLYVNYSVLIISGNTFQNNTSNWGCAITLNNHGNSIITGNLIISNYGGGILFKSGPDGIAINNSIVDNYWSGGITCLSGCHPKIVNNIIRDNEQYNIYTTGGRQPEVSYNNISGGWGGIGNIDFDPLFRNPDNGDYHLMASLCGDPYDSPCIDMGDPRIIDSVLGCDYGLGDIRADMGAFGGGDSAQLAVEDNFETSVTVIKLNSNYPNPFNSSTSIQYELSSETQVKVEIYDMLGRKVSTLENEIQPAGEYSLLWDTDHISSGVYLYTIRAGAYFQTKMMTLIK